MLALVLCLMIQLDPDRELLTGENVTDEQLAVITEELKGKAPDRKTGRISRTEMRRLVRIVQRVAKEQWKANVPNDEGEDIVEDALALLDDKSETSPFTVKFNLTHDKFKGSYYHTAEVTTFKAPTQTFRVSFLIPKEGDYVPMTAALVIRDDDTDDFRRVKSVDCLVNGNNVYSTTEAESDLDTTATVGTWYESLSARLKPDEAKTIFDNPDSEITFRFGIEEIALDKPTVNKLNAWLTKNHPAFQEQKDRE